MMIKTTAVDTSKKYAKDVVITLGPELKAVDVVDWVNPMNGGGRGSPAQRRPPMFMGGIPVNISSCVLMGRNGWQRIGREICLKQLKLKYKLVAFNENSGVNEPRELLEFIRLMVVVDRAPDGTKPFAVDLLRGYTADGNVINEFFAGHQNLDTKDRFDIVWDRQYIFPYGEDGNVTPPGFESSRDLMHINENIDLKNIVSKYSSSTGSVGDVTANAVYVFFCGNVDDGGDLTASFSLEGNARLEYYDVEGS